MDHFRGIQIRVMSLLLFDYRRMVNHGLVRSLVVTLFGLSVS